MPTYEYACDTCGLNFEIERSIHEPLLTECPDCESPLRQIFGVPFMFAYGEPTNLHHQAARNTEKLSSAEISERRERAREEKIKRLESANPRGGNLPDFRKVKRPWYRDGKLGCPKLDKPLDATKFVDSETGELNKKAKDFIEKGKLDANSTT